VIAMVIRGFEPGGVRRAMDHVRRGLAPLVRGSMMSLTLVRDAVRDGAAGRPHDGQQQNPPWKPCRPGARAHA